MIEESQDAWDFRVDPYNGALSIEKPLDYEQKVSYEIRVVAQDLGSPPRSDVTVVQVMVEDVNDSPPVFVDSPYVAYVQVIIAYQPLHRLCTGNNSLCTGNNSISTITSPMYL